MKKNFSTIDLHNHLYGNLSPQELWEIGKDLWPSRVPRLDWYANEFEKACGYKPDYRSYWNVDEGSHILGQDYLLTTQVDFAIFQAKFNLLIALCPMSDTESLVLDKVLSHQNPDSFVEYRMIFPNKSSPLDRGKILDLYATKLYEASVARDTHARIAWSLSRDPEDFFESFKCIHEWRLNNRKLAHFFSGIDLCGDEELDPPFNKEIVFKTVQDIQNHSKLPPMLILHHVGEVFKKSSFFTALRRVYEVCKMSYAERIGHASALSIGLSHLPDQGFLIEDNENEYEKNCRFYPKYMERFSSYKSTNPEWKSYAYAMQDLVWSRIESLDSKKDLIFETCPTSNFLISACQEQDLPVHGFLKRAESIPKPNWKVILGSDDPGIMNTTLKQEYERISKLLPNKVQSANLHRSTQEYFEKTYSVFFP